MRLTARRGVLVAMLGMVAFLALLIDAACGSVIAGMKTYPTAMVLIIAPGPWPHRTPTV